MRAAEGYVVKYDLVRHTAEIDGHRGTGEGNTKGNERAEAGVVSRTRSAHSRRQNQGSEQRTRSVQAAPYVDGAADVDGCVVKREARGEARCDIDEGVRTRQEEQRSVLGIRIPKSTARGVRTDVIQVIQADGQRIVGKETPKFGPLNPALLVPPL